MDSPPLREPYATAFYKAGVHWIASNRTNGGWPPRHVGAVSGWTVVRMLADLTGRIPREVARDVIAQQQKE